MFDERPPVQSRNNENRSILGQFRERNLEKCLDGKRPDRFEICENTGLRSTYPEIKKNLLEFDTQSIQ